MSNSFERLRTILPKVKFLVNGYIRICIQNKLFKQQSMEKAYYNIPQLINNHCILYYNGPKVTDEELKWLQAMNVLNNTELYEALTMQWEHLLRIGKEKLLTTDCRQLRKNIRSMEYTLSKLPNKLRIYPEYGKFIDILKNKKKINNKILRELSAGGLSTPILREKHWKKLSKALNIDVSNGDEVFVEDIWSINNIWKYLTEICEICMEAQGEGAVRNFLDELNVIWGEVKCYKVIYYQNKYPIIKNLRELLQEVADAQLDIQSMTQSPYYKPFEGQKIEWEKRLGMIDNVLQVMLTVQQGWVFWHNWFDNKGDDEIVGDTENENDEVDDKAQDEHKDRTECLAVEEEENDDNSNNEDVEVRYWEVYSVVYEQFQVFDGEFIGLMKEIKDKPLVDNGMLKNQILLERLQGYQSTLKQIEKAWSDK